MHVLPSDILVTYEHSESDLYSSCIATSEKFW
jgi:hypothetical protein